MSQSTFMPVASWGCPSADWAPTRLTIAIGIVAIGLAYLLSYSPHWFVGTDSALYLSLGRNLAEGKGYIYAGQPHTHVPPGLPALLAGLEYIGVGSIAVFNAAMLLMGLLALAASYLLLKSTAGHAWAALLTLVLAFTQEWVQRSGELISDIPFALLVITALSLLYRTDARPRVVCWGLASIFLIAACWVRVHGFPIAAAAGLGTLISCWKQDRWKALGVPAALLIGCGISLIVFYSYYKSHVDPFASSYLHSVSQISGGKVLQTFLRNLGELPNQLCRLLTGQRMPLPVSILLFCLPIAIAAARRVVRRETVGPLTIVFYLAAILPVIVRTRYLLPLAPLLMLYLIEGWVWLLGLTPRIAPPARTRIILIALAVMLAMNLALVGRLIYQKRQSDFATNQQKGAWAYLPPLTDFLATQPEGAILAPPPVGYLSRRNCPMVSRGLLNSRLDAPRTAELLAHWNVRYILLDRSDKWFPLYDSLEEFVARGQAPIWARGKVELYAVGPDLTPRQPATGSAQR